MKRVFLATATLLVISAATFAQESPQNVVKVNPLGILFGNASVAYERALNEKSSIVLAPSFGFFKLADAKYSSVGIGAEYRFYLSQTRTAPAGLYAAPGVGYTGGSVKINDGQGGTTKTNFSAFYGKAIIGNQWIWDSGFSLDLNGGIQYISFTYKDKSGSFSGLKASGILPALGVSIGYAF